MDEVQTVHREDRLPWLGEEGDGPRDHRTRDAIGLAIVAALLIFGVSYWIASQNWQRERAQREAASAPPALGPVPKAAHPPLAATHAPRHRQATAGTATKSVVAQRAAPHPKQQLAANKPVTATVAPKPAAKAPAVVARTKAPAAAKPAASVAEQRQFASPALETGGATGRIVRVGAFASPVQARLGWQSMVRAYPALAHLPAVVIDTSAHGQASYRFQIGTGSQASSDVLCQRMQRINFTCAVMGRSGSARGLEG